VNDEMEQNIVIYIAAVGTLATFITYIEASGHSLAAGIVAGASGIVALLIVGAIARRSIR